MLSQDANARTPNNSQAVSAAKRLREAHTSHTSALRDQLLSRVAESIASALTTNAAQELQSAIAEAADARARADAAVRTIASVRDSAAVVTSSIQKKFDHEHAAVSALEKRVQFLVNTIKEKDRILARSMLASAVDSAREASTESEDEGASSESTKTSGPALRKKIECAVDAEACMSSLLLYPSLSEPVTETISTSFHGARNLKERPIPEFSVALKNYLQAISPYSDRANPALALSAYTQLWRSVSAPGRKGWRGEIMSMVLAECNSDLVSSASVSPDLRRALVSDLRMLHSLHRTPASDVVAWLGENVGVSPPPLTLPEYGTVSLPLTNVLEDTPVETLNGFDKSQHADQMKKLIDLLDQAEDWGHDDVVEAVVQNFQEGSSEASTLAEHYYGLRWNANGVLQGLLSSRDVGELPEYHFVGIEGIRNRLCQNCEFLLHDLTASNVHVWGPPGSGKSSCVMSLLKQFGARGLRIIEVTKETLATLPDLFEVISKLRQKFIVFVDDLTFEEHESEQMRLAKAALEGSLRMNPTNVFVLCTSNRRFPVGSRLTDASEEKLAFSFRYVEVALYLPVSFIILNMVFWGFFVRVNWSICLHVSFCCRCRKPLLYFTFPSRLYTLIVVSQVRNYSGFPENNERSISSHRPHACEGARCCDARRRARRFGIDVGSRAGW